MTEHRSAPPIAILHLDESCLGNGREGENSGGGGGLIEARSGNRKIQRRDFYISSPATTNNRMALSGAIAALQVLIVSDSQYLVKGMREWVPGWIGRGWKRKEGPIENLELWQVLVKSVRLHEDVHWTWVRGHHDHPKNIYADRLAVAAAERQTTSDGIIESGFDEWFAAQQAKGKFASYDPDAAFAELEKRVAAGEDFALAE